MQILLLMPIASLLAAVLLQVYGIIYRALDHSLISPFVSFAKGFEFAIILIVGISFFILSVFLVLRQAKKLPNSYSIEVIDVFSQSAEIEGLRTKFKTYDAAESYARLYRIEYAGQYQFRVVGSERRYGK